MNEGTVADCKKSAIDKAVFKIPGIGIQAIVQAVVDQATISSANDR